MRYGIQFYEYENHFSKPTLTQIQIGGLDNHNVKMSRYNIEKGVEFETDDLETAKRIAIGFANFFTDTVFHTTDWKEPDYWYLTNMQILPTFDETGFRQSEKSYKVKLINLDTFYEQRRLRNGER